MKTKQRLCNAFWNIHQCLSFKFLFTNRLGNSSMKDHDRREEKRNHHSRTSSAPTKDLASFAEEYRKLSIDCLKVLRVEMQLETVFHMQVLTCIFVIYI